jgi:peptidoglycan/xylan/chitin deacetylase (PgdA/CDA1 family)
VALTFDDGPAAGGIAKITDILEAAGGHGTFFVVGNRVEGSRAEVVYAAQHAEEIDNHTWSHKQLVRSAAFDEEQIGLADAEIASVTGTRPLWVRAHGGLIDATGLSCAFGGGHLVANWDVRAGDTDLSLSSSRIAANVLAGVHPGAVVLMHVTNPRSIAALPAVVAGLKARGYQMVTLSTLAGGR